MTFSDDLKRFTTHVEHKSRDVYVGIATKVHESVKVGSAITGSPGQPVDTGYLRNSWILSIGAQEAEISTNVAYAPVIEYNDRSQYDAGGVLPPDPAGGVGRKSIKSTTGGNHSVKLTVAGANNIQAAVLAGVGR